MIKISSLRRKADPLLIVSKRLPSYIKKEKIKLTRNSNVNKKNVKYYQVPHFVQELIKFTRKNKLWKEQNNENIMDINNININNNNNNNDHACYNNIINKNKIHYVNNLLNEIPKNKNLLTSYLICEIYGCLYKLNYLKLDIIFLLFSILINNTINFFNLSGYVNCNFKELINITKYIYHFQKVCNSNIQNILHKKPNLTELKIVQRYLKENNKEMKSKHGCYNYIYNYIQKYDHIDNIDILIYSLIKCKKDEKGYIYEKIKKKDIVLDDENDITSNIRNMSNMSNISNISNISNMSNISNIFPPAITNTSNHNNPLVEDNNEMDRLIDYINSFYKLNDMFNFLLNKILNYFNENSVNFDFHNLKLLFFFISKFEKFGTNLLENISNRLISEIEKMKTNPKSLDDEENSTNDPLEKNIVNHLNHNKIKRRLNMYNKKMRYINTFNKINSKEFLILPYTIGLSMNRYFNNYLIEYINIYILSLINSRVNCDIQTFIYTLIGYRHIMVNFFILYNIFLFKEKCFQNENLLKKYKFFLNKLIHHDIQNMNQISSNKIIKIKNHMMNNKIKSEEETNIMNHNKYINVLNLEDTKHTINHLNLDQNISVQSVKEQDLHNIYYTSSKNELKINQENIFDLLIKEFHINLEKIMLINFDKNSLYQQYTSKDIYHFFITYKKLFQKVYNYSIFLLDKHNINDMLTIYQHIKAHSLNDIIINHVFIETLYNKIILNSVPKKN